MSAERETQDTEPRKGKPVKIPVPTREEVFEVFEKVAKTPDPDTPADERDTKE